MTRSLDFQAWRTSNSKSDFASTTSISLTTAGGSRRRLSQRRPFLWRRRSASHTFWYRFERRTLRRGSVSDRSWHDFDWRSFNIHFCLTLQSHTCFAFSGERKGAQLNKFTIRVRENNLIIHIHIRKRNRHHRHNRRRGRQTQRKTQAIPNTLHLRSGTEKLEYFAKQTMVTNSLTVKSKPLPFFSLHLSSYFYFLLHWLPCSSSSFLLLYLPHPPAANCWESFPDAWLSIHGASLRLFWTRLLCLPIFSLWRISITLFASWILQTLPEAFCTPSWWHFFTLQFSILSHSWQGPSLLRVLRLVLTSFNTLSCAFSPVCIDSSIWVTCCAAHNPYTFCTKLRPLHFGQLFSPCRVLPNVICSIFPACVSSLLANTLVHHMFLVFLLLLLLPHLMRRYAIAVTHHSVRRFLTSPLLLTKKQFFFLTSA